MKTYIKKPTKIYTEQFNGGDSVYRIKQLLGTDVTLTREGLIFQYGCRVHYVYPMDYVCVEVARWGRHVSIHECSSFEKDYIDVTSKAEVKL